MRSSITILVFAAVLAAGCTTGSAAPDDGTLAVVATTTQVGSIAREVGGDAISLTVLLQPGAEAHDYEMTPAAAAAIEDAALVLRSGAGLESWLDDALSTIGGSGLMRDMSEGIDLRAPVGAEPAYKDEEEPGHDEEVDPHYWLSAPSAVLMVENVRDALAEADPGNAGAFAERADGLIARLEEADATIRELMAEIPTERRGIVTNHDALGYFIEEYGLRFVGSVFPSLDVSAEPSPGDLAELIETIRGEGVVAIFSESAVAPELARAVADETGAEVVDDPLYTDSLGPEGSGAETLDAMLIHNATVIHDALAGE
jgi:zinc/manganese transport system substrate-binding protein